jgi:hypothetical protein
MKSFSLKLSSIKNNNNNNYHYCYYISALFKTGDPSLALDSVGATRDGSDLTSSLKRL